MKMMKKLYILTTKRYEYLTFNICIWLSILICKRKTASAMAKAKLIIFPPKHKKDLSSPGTGEVLFCLGEILRQR